MEEAEVDVAALMEIGGPVVRRSIEEAARDKAEEERMHGLYVAEREADIAQGNRAMALNAALGLAQQDDRPWEASEVVDAAKAFADFLNGIVTLPASQPN